MCPTNTHGPQLHPRCSIPPYHWAEDSHDGDGYDWPPMWDQSLVSLGTVQQVKFAVCDLITFHVVTLAKALAVNRLIYHTSQCVPDT